MAPNIEPKTESEKLDPHMEAKFEELKLEVIKKIDKELSDSLNARKYVSQKYDDLCKKIHSLSELQATVSSFRSDVKCIENQIGELLTRIDSFENKL